MLFLASITLGFFANYIPQKIVFLYFGASVVTFIIYAYDKSQAKRGAWRTKESTLHMLSIIGGWPGAGLAQQWLRHKSSKKAFRIAYWATVFVNLTCLGVLYYYAGNNY